jgi:hypothetical protein
MKPGKNQKIIFRFILAIILSACTGSLIAQTVQSDSMTQYLLPAFSRGIVKIKNEASQSVVMNYNTVTEKMVFKQNGDLMDMINLEKIDTILLHNAKFVPVENVFYEVLVNAPVSLFIQHKSDLKSTGRPAAYGTTSQTSGPSSLSKLYSNNKSYNMKLPEDYKVTSSSVDWIRVNGTMHKFFTKSQFIRIFPSHTDEIKKLIEQNNIDIRNRDDLIKLVSYCNALYR